MDLEDVGIICLIAVVVLGLYALISFADEQEQKESRANYAECLKHSDNKDWCVETSFGIKLTEPAK